MRHRESTSPYRGALWVLLFLLILSSPQLLQASEGASIEAEAEEMVALLESLSSVIESNASDCDAMATALVKFEQEKGERMRSLSTKLAEIPEDASASLQSKFTARLNAAGEAMSPGLLVCSTNDSVNQTMQALSIGTPEEARTAAAVKEVEALCSQWKLAVELSRGDCDVLGEELKKLLVGKKIKAHLSTKRDEVKAAFQACEGAIEATHACKENPAILEALEELR